MNRCEVSLFSQAMDTSLFVKQIRRSAAPETHALSDRSPFSPRIVLPLNLLPFSFSFSNRPASPCDSRQPPALCAGFFEGEGGGSCARKVWEMKGDYLCSALADRDTLRIICPTTDIYIFVCQVPSSEAAKVPGAIQPGSGRCYPRCYPLIKAIAKGNIVGQRKVSMDAGVFESFFHMHQTLREELPPKYAAKRELIAWEWENVVPLAQPFYLVKGGRIGWALFEAGDGLLQRPSTPPRMKLNEPDRSHPVLNADTERARMARGDWRRAVGEGRPVPRLPRLPDDPEQSWKESSEEHDGRGATVDRRRAPDDPEQSWKESSTLERVVDHYIHIPNLGRLSYQRLWRRTRQAQAKDKMRRILVAMKERGNDATLDQLGEVYMQRCRSSASREALARLLRQELGIGIARGGIVGTSASASGSSEAPSGSGGGVPSLPAAVGPGECDPGESDDPRECEYESQCSEGQPPSKRMKQAGPSEDCKDNNQE